MSLFFFGLGGCSSIEISSSVSDQLKRPSFVMFLNYCGLEAGEKMTISDYMPFSPAILSISTALVKMLPSSR